MLKIRDRNGGNVSGAACRADRTEEVRVLDNRPEWSRFIPRQRVKGIQHLIAINRKAINETMGSHSMPSPG